jgi:antitoxin (DNA-binding transcriptional repressor) of toxin-antitoxin stability system
MKVPISEFRKNLFQIANQVLEGDDVEVAHKGQTIRLVLATSGSKLSRLTPAQIFNPDISDEEHAHASRELFAEMQREWEKDWSEL